MFSLSQSCTTTGCHHEATVRFHDDPVCVRCFVSNVSNDDEQRNVHTLDHKRHTYNRIKSMMTY